VTKQDLALKADETAVLERTEQFVRETLANDSSGHDWWHIHRVRANARHIASEEAGCNRYVVELAAMLHDIADWKFHGGDLKAGSKKARVWLEQQNVPADVIDKVCEIIDTTSYKGAGVKTEMTSLEGMVVQDADRLDALGAIGIARAFAYGGHMDRSMYEPDVKPTMHGSFEEYKNSKGHTINHFYEKLLLLKERMNTGTARKIADKRHAFMEEYLERFFGEWDGRM
jgi:uncharacterized protein